MKKFIALLLILSLLAGALLCFASCDGEEDPNSDGNNTNDTEQGDSGNNGDNGNNTEPDLTDDIYPEDVANDIF